jgi:SsrA-binding protein
MAGKGLLLAKNRKAMFNHTLLERYCAGIVLKGYEVKAIREGKVDFEGSYIRPIGGVLNVISLYIGKYSKQAKTSEKFEEKRSRPLLLNKKEIADIERELLEKGKTAVPTALVMQNGKIKLEFAIVKGKKEFEKKQTAKDRQVKIDLAKESKEIKRSIWTQ